MSSTTDVFAISADAVLNSSQHIWLHTNRSLCDRAVRFANPDETEAAELSAAVQEKPACGSCLLIVETLKNTASKLLAAAEFRIYPESPLDAATLMEKTGWQWVVSMDSWPQRAAALGYPKFPMKKKVD